LKVDSCRNCQPSSIETLQKFKGIDFPGDIRFRQILVTGPPGAGKSTLIRRLGGWSEEGYLDLARKHWWRSEILSVRPREIHLGMPFRGLGNSVAVFDSQFLDSRSVAALDFERIVLPPRKRFFFSVDWYRRYVFEFLLPPAPIIFQRRPRARGTVPTRWTNGSAWRSASSQTRGIPPSWPSTSAPERVLRIPARGDGEPALALRRAPVAAMMAPCLADGRLTFFEPAGRA
jgi:hypothetical protein